MILCKAQKTILETDFLLAGAPFESISQTKRPAQGSTWQSSISRTSINTIEVNGDRDGDGVVRREHEKDLHKVGAVEVLASE